MTNPIAQAHQALVARLARITKANGFLTDAGARIKEGWLSELLAEDDVEFPFIALQPAEYPPPKAGPGCVSANIGRRIVGAVQPDGPDTYRADLDELYIDLVGALQVPEGLPNPWGRPGPYGVTLGASQLFPPGEGLAAGTILIPVQLHVIIPGA